jgi:hypothetical protein
LAFPVAALSQNEALPQHGLRALTQHLRKIKASQKNLESGNVPDARTAARIAEILLTSVHQAKQTDDERPFMATLHRHAWTIRGSLHYENTEKSV